MSGRVWSLILAAGASRRLGQPKALVRLPTGQTLLEQAVATARAAALEVAVTVPADDPAIAAAAGGCVGAGQPPPRVIPVADATDGMSASIRAGIGALSREPDIEGVLILLVDQWRLNAQDLALLRDHWAQHRRHVAAARYEGVLGVPALFGREYFDTLQALRGDRGARDYLRSGNPAVTAVDLPNAGADLDAPDDLSELHRPSVRRSVR